MVLSFPLEFLLNSTGILLLTASMDGMSFDWKIPIYKESLSARPSLCRYDPMRFKEVV